MSRCLIKIDKGVPFPEMRNGKVVQNKYPILEMKVGDSYLVPFSPCSTNKELQSKALSAAYCTAKNNKKKWKFISRAEANGVRIWRLK